MSYQNGNGTIHNDLRSIMKKRAWWSPLDLQAAYLDKTGNLRLDATITRRLREMSDVISQRRRVEVLPGHFAWRDCYRLIKTGKVAA